MTALWASNVSDGNGDSYSGWGDGDGNGDSDDGWGGGDDSSDSSGCSDDGWGDGNGNGDSDGDGNSDGFGYPEQEYDGHTAIGRLLTHEAILPIADLLTLAVTR